MKQVIITLLAASVLFCACGGNTEVNEQQAAVVNNEVQWTDSVIFIQPGISHNYLFLVQLK